MSKMDEVRALVAETLGVPMETIAPETRRGDVPQWDSLGHLRLVTALEDAFGLRLSMARIGEIDSVQDIAAEVEPARA